MLLSRAASGTALVASILTSATTWAGEDDCSKYSYDSEAKTGHIFERIPTYNDSADKRTIAYLGFTIDPAGPAWLAMCSVDKNGNEHFDTLHFENASGQEGASIPASATFYPSTGQTTIRGHLEWKLSMCGTAMDNKLFGAYVFNARKVVNKYTCDGRQFEPIGINATGRLWVYTSTGDDSIYVLA